MIAYDFDGVLAESPPASTKPWGQMNGRERAQRQQALLDHYGKAQPLLIPKEPFIVISARKETADIRFVSTQWLKTHHQHNFQELHLLPIARTIKNVVTFKAAILQHTQATTFTEDNRNILKGLKSITELTCQLYYWKQGMNEPIPYTQRINT